MKQKTFLLLFFLIAVLFFNGETLLAEKASDRPLIQTTTPEGDYLALSRLELLNTALLSEANVQKAYENVLCSSVRIQADGHYGSGTIYKMLEDEIIIVTNRHVLQYFNDDSYVTFFNGRVGSGNRLGSSETADIGFISIPVSDFDWQELLEFRNVRSSTRRYESLKENDCYFMIDMASDSLNPQFFEGQVLDKDRYLPDFETEMLYGEGYAVPGMSGCGLFDACGYYVGMLAGGTLQNEIAGVPVTAIEEAFQEIVKEK